MAPVLASIVPFGEMEYMYGAVPFEPVAMALPSQAPKQEAFTLLLTVMMHCENVFCVIRTKINNACTANTTAFLIGPNAPVPAVSNITNVTCNGLCNGSAVVNATGGIPPITYAITAPGIINPATGVIPSVLCAGIYTTTATDANGCIGTSVFTITEPLLLSLNINSVSPNCNGTCDGSITPAAFGGTAPFVYTITGNNYNNLCSGNYTVTVVDANNCQSATIVNLVAGGYNNSIDPAAITGAGSITSTPAGGTAPYEFSLNGAAFTANNSFNMLCAGTYTLTIKDSYGAGCLKDTIVSVLNTANTFPGGSIVPFLVNPTCQLTTDGMVTLMISPVNNYQYQWSNGGNSYFINNLPANTYSVTITNPAGECVQNVYTLTAIGNNCGNITGKIYYDSIQNCVKEIVENGIPNTMLIANPGNHITFTDASGNYAYHGLPYGNYNVTHQNNLVAFNTNCGNNTAVTINNAVPNQVANFGDTSSLQIDYSISISAPWCFVVANPIKALFIDYYHSNPNMQYANSAGTVYAVLDSISHFQMANPAPSSIAGDTLFWNVNNIGFFNQAILVNFVFPNNYTAANTFPLKVGIKNIQYSDTILLNNIQNMTIPFCNAYDPNNKIVTPKGEGPAGNIDINDANTKLLTYYINFQNTGNAPAYNIVIEDTLSEKLDLSTFKVLSTSHPYQLEVINNEVIKWKFYNIMLPDSNANEPESHGQIIYQIMQKNTNIVGDEITNTAYIYFDYNPAIITNQTLNTLFMPSSVKDIQTDTKITIYPNPASDVVYIESAKEFSEVIVYDLQMKKVSTRTASMSKKSELNIKDLKEGIYFIKTNNGQIRKLIIQR